MNSGVYRNTGINYIYKNRKVLCLYSVFLRIYEDQHIYQWCLEDTLRISMHLDLPYNLSSLGFTDFNLASQCLAHRALLAALVLALRVSRDCLLHHFVPQYF